MSYLKGPTLLLTLATGRVCCRITQDYIDCVGHGDGEMNEEALAELTALLVRIQNGRDDEACQELWDAVFDRVITVARKRLSSHHRRVVDEEDIALSAINSFLRAAEHGRLRSYQNRDELWRVLFLITARKFFNAARSNQQRNVGMASYAVILFSRHPMGSMLAELPVFRIRDIPIDLWIV